MAWMLSSLDAPAPSGEGTLLDLVADEAPAEALAPLAESLSPDAPALEQLQGDRYSARHLRDERQPR